MDEQLNVLIYNHKIQKWISCSQQGYSPISKTRGYENRGQYMALSVITGEEVGPKIVCIARNYGTRKVTYRNDNRNRRDVLSL